MIKKLRNHPYAPKVGAKRKKKLFMPPALTLEKSEFCPQRIFMGFT
jgi:hypothetical protein